MKHLGYFFGIKEYNRYLCMMEQDVSQYMIKEKKIGMVLAGDASREELEKTAYERLKRSWLAMLKNAVKRGYAEKGSEGEVTVRMTVTYDC